MVIKMQDHGFNPICEGVENTHIHLVVWWCSTQLIGLTFCEMMIMCFINPKSLDLFADQSKPGHEHRHSNRAVDQCNGSKGL